MYLSRILGYAANPIDAARGLQRLAIVLCASVPLSACIIPVPTDTRYDGVASTAVKRAESKAKLASLVGAPDAVTADGRFVLYRFDKEREWGLAIVAGQAGDVIDLPGKGHKKLDMLIEFDVNNVTKQRTTQGCADTARETPCNVSNEDALWALIERMEGREGASRYRESLATIAPLIEPLHAAAKDGDVAAVRQLLERGASPRSEVEGETPLHVAAANGRSAVMEALVSAGVGIDARGDAGETPLFRAASAGQTEAVAWLIDHGADVHAGDGVPLQAAARGDHQEAVKQLLRVEQGTAALDAALTVAVERGNVQNVDALLGAGARVTRHGWSVPPLSVAAASGHVAVAERLLAAGAPVDESAAGRQHATPLHQAIKRGDLAMCELLLAHGASIKETTRTGLGVERAGRLETVTALELAKRAEQADIVHLLEQQQVPPEAGRVAERRLR